MTSVLVPEGTDAKDGGQTRPPQRRASRTRSRRRFVVVFLVVAAVWAFFAYRSADTARTEARHGRSTLATLDALQFGDATDGTLRRELVDAQQHLLNAQRSLGSFWLKPVGVLPVARTQIRSAEAMNDGALEILTVGIDAVDEAERILADPPQTGPERVDVLGRVSDELDATISVLDDVDLGPTTGLLSELAVARTEFDAERVALLDRLRSVDRSLELVHGLASGPRRYLLVASNNAEMRAGQGMALFAGVLTIENGDLSTSDLTSTSANSLRVPQPVSLGDDDFELNWGYAEPGSDFRNLGLSPRFDLTAEIGTRFWESSQGGTLDGMIMVDPVVVASLLGVTGPIEVEGLTLTSENALDYLLRDQYLDPRFVNYDTDAQYPLIVSALMDKLTAASFDPFDLASALADSARGRHLMAWSRSADDQDLWEAAGVTGAVSDRSFGISIQNAGGNKLDYGLDVTSDIEVRRGTESGGTEILVSVEIANDEPTLGLPYPRVRGLDLDDGTYVGVLSVTLPAEAREIDVRGVGALSRLGPDGPTIAATTGRFVIAPGDATTVEISFVVPSRLEELVIESSARVPAISHTVGDRTRRDTRPLTLDLTTEQAVLR